MDQFWEEAVVKRHQGLQNALYILATVLAAALMAFALMLLGALADVYADEGLGTGFFLALGEILLCGGVGALLFYFRDRIKTEYEYAFTAGLLDFAQVFNKTGRPCPICGTTIEKIKVAGRGTHICPNCQHRRVIRAEGAPRGACDAGEENLAGPVRRLVYD